MIGLTLIKFSLVMPDKDELWVERIPFDKAADCGTTRVL